MFLLKLLCDDALETAAVRAVLESALTAAEEAARQQRKGVAAAREEAKDARARLREIEVGWSLSADLTQVSWGFDCIVTILGFARQIRMVLKQDPDKPNRPLGESAEDLPPLPFTEALYCRSLRFRTFPRPQFSRSRVAALAVSCWAPRM